MLNFMIEGGFNMWLMLLTAIALAAFALTRPAPKRSAVFHAGTVLVVIESVAGMAAGMKAVAAYTERGEFAQMAGQAAVVAQGLGELANNGLLGAVFALGLGIAALLTRRAPAAA